MTILDIHHHVGSLADMISGEGAPSGTAERAAQADLVTRLEYMDRSGIAQAVLMPSNGVPAPNGFVDRRAENDRLVAYRNLEPSRFPAALGTVSPHDGKLALDEIDRCIEDLGMAGIVWHHRFLGTPINHAMMDAFLDRLAHHGVPAFVHIIAGSTLESPWRLEMLADRHPDVTFVALDGFSSTDQAQWMPYLAAKHPNIVFDTGVMVAVAHMIEPFLAAVGPHRLLFGSDFYSAPRLFSVAFPLVEIPAMGLPEATVDAVLGGNARRLLKLDDGRELESSD